MKVYQGLQADVTLLVVGLSDPKHPAEFIQHHRLNVAITRAKGCLVIIGSKPCFEQDLMAGSRKRPQDMINFITDLESKKSIMPIDTTKPFQLGSIREQLCNNLRQLAKSRPDLFVSKSWAEQKRAELLELEKKHTVDTLF